MTRVNIFIDGSDNRLNGITKFNYRAITIDGHAGIKELCNAISTLGWTLAGTLQNLRGEVDFTEDSDKGFMGIWLSGSPDTRSNTAFETILIGLKQLEEKYKKNISITFQLKEQATNGGSIQKV